MQHLLAKRSAVKPPKELSCLFADPPVIRNESVADYESLFSAIAAAARPTDAIAWMFVRDIADLSWEIRRERSLKLHIIGDAEQTAVQDLLTPPMRSPWIKIYETDPNLPPGVISARKEARKWASGDATVCRKVDKKLAEEGADASFILLAGIEISGSQVDAIDKRIATYEMRRMAALKEIELWNGILARRLELASSEVIEGEFTEAAE